MLTPSRGVSPRLGFKLSALDVLQALPFTNVVGKWAPTRALSESLFITMTRTAKEREIQPTVPSTTHEMTLELSLIQVNIRSREWSPSQEGQIDVGKTYIQGLPRQGQATRISNTHSRYCIYFIGARMPARACARGCDHCGDRYIN